MTKKEILIQDALGTIEPWKLSMNGLIYLSQHNKRPARGLSKIRSKIRTLYLKMWGWGDEDFKYETYVKCLQQLGHFPEGVK